MIENIFYAGHLTIELNAYCALSPNKLYLQIKHTVHEDSDSVAK
jgi:hypothetical protein